MKYILFLLACNANSETKDISAQNMKHGVQEKGTTSITASNQEAKYLYFDIQIDADTMNVTAQLGGTNQLLNLTEFKSEIESAFNDMYEIIKQVSESKDYRLSRDIEYLSRTLMEPFSAMLSQVTHIVFQIDEYSVRFALDLLHHNGTPLFLTHQITYTSTSFEIQTDPNVQVDKAYLVADFTCDPENGLRQVSNHLDNSLFHTMGESDLDTIIEHTLEKDILVISAHGRVEDDGTGSIEINDEELDTDLLEEIQVVLTYFDSCQTGVCWDFIETFTEEKSTHYYVAPIISNDAGDSSTKTVIWFFEHIKKSGNPADALYQTRKALYNFYTDKALNLVTVLNKAFAFRLYEFES